MTRDNDDIADALSKMTSGDAPSPSPQAPASRPTTPGGSEKRARPAAPTAIPAQPSRTTNEHTTPVNAPGPQPFPKPALAPAPQIAGIKPAKPARPAMPTLSSAPLRPGAPPQVPALVQSDPFAISGAAESNDEDVSSVIVPAMAPSTYVRRPPPPPRGPSLYAQLAFRRTMIPILLTMGISLPGCAIAWLFLDEDSALKSLSAGYPITLAVVGLVMLALGIANMLQVRAQLAKG